MQWKETLKSMGLPADPNGDFQEMTEAKWSSTPVGWNGKKWGCQDKLGWQKRLGGGTMYDGKFQLEPPLVTVQEFCRGLAASQHVCSLRALSCYFYIIGALRKK